MRHFIPVLVFLLGIQSVVLSQNGDCITATQVCATFFNETTPPSGIGQQSEYVGDCNWLSGETNSKWYIITVQQSGMLSFILDPSNDNVDYDWALFDITNGGCGSIGPGTEVSCNSWGSINPYQGPTGMSTAMGGNSNTNGPGDDWPYIPFNQSLFVNAGQQFALVVMNWTLGLSSAFTLDFSGSTAVIADVLPPAFANVTANCGNNALNVTFNEGIKLSSLQNTDFTLTGPGGSYGVTGIIPQAPGLTEDVFTFNLNQAIVVPGTYTLTITSQSAGIQDACGNVSISGSFNFQINAPLSFSVQVTSACNGAGGAIAVSSLQGGVGPFVFSVNGVAQPELEALNLAGGFYALQIKDAQNCTVTQNVQVPNSEISVTIPQQQTPISCANPEVTITGLTIQPQQQSVNYSWNSTNNQGQIVSGSNGPSPSVSAPAQYNVTVTNPQSGCSATASVTITTSEEVDVTPPTLNSIITDCSNNFITLVFSENIVLSSIQNTDFTITGPGGNVNIGSFGAENSGASSDDHIIITFTQTVTTPGDYTFTITNNSGQVEDACGNAGGGTSTFTLSAPIIYTPQIDLGCNEEGATIEIINLTGGEAPYTFLFDGVEQEGFTVEDVPSGSYPVVITDGTGCSSTQNITVSNPELIITFPNSQAQLSCSNPYVTIQGLTVSPTQNVNYTWSSVDNLGVFISGTSGASPIVAASAQYVVVAFNPLTGCSNNATVSVFSDGTHDLESPDFIGANENCDNTQFTLMFSELISMQTVATGDFAINGPNGSVPVTSAGPLSPGANADNEIVITVAQPLPAGTYTISLTNNLGSVEDQCGNPANGSVQLTVFPILDYQLDVTQGCNGVGGRIELVNLSGGEGPYVFRLNNVVQSDFDVTGLGAGEYTISVNDIRGCIKTEVVEVAMYEVEVSIPEQEEVLTCLNPTMEIFGVVVTPSQDVVYEWTSVDGLGEIVSGENTSSPRIGAPGMYEVVVTNPDNGCSDSEFTEVFEGELYSVDMSSLTFPNIITLDGDGKQNNDTWFPFLRSYPEIDLRTIFNEFNLQVFNRWGSNVYESSEIREWAPSDLEEGTYFYIVKYNTDCGTGANGTQQGTIQLMRKK